MNSSTKLAALALATIFVGEMQSLRAQPFVPRGFRGFMPGGVLRMVVPDAEDFRTTLCRRTQTRWTCQPAQRVRNRADGRGESNCRVSELPEEELRIA